MQKFSKHLQDFEYMFTELHNRYHAIQKYIFNKKVILVKQSTSQRDYVRRKKCLDLK